MGSSIEACRLHVPILARQCRVGGPEFFLLFRGFAVVPSFKPFVDVPCDASFGAGHVLLPLFTLLCAGINP